MRIGYIGLGKMGKNMVMNMIDHQHEVIAWNRSPAPLEEVCAYGASKADSITDLVSHLPSPRTIWMMLPAGEVTEDMLFGSYRLVDQLSPGDILIDGANSHFHDTMKRAKMCAERGIYFLDVGTSGGPYGARHGACLMIGGDRRVYESLIPLFASLSAPDGFLYIGPSGSGHYVKMVHNAIEYGFMQSIGEGFDMLQHGPLGKLPLGQIARVWNHGSVIESKLMLLAETVFAEYGDLSSIVGYVEDNGETQWTVETALQYKIPLTTLAHALFARYASRREDSFAMKVVAALRHQFGGHSIKEKR